MSPNTQPCTPCGGRGRFGAAKQWRCDVCRGKGYVRKLSSDPANIARRDARRRANLLDPQYGSPRRFPTFYPGMTTASYVSTFAAINEPTKPVTYLHAGGPAPMLDPLVPEVVFEHEADCIEPSPALCALMGWK
jgi:hypothetical protein